MRHNSRRNSIMSLITKTTENDTSAGKFLYASEVSLLGHEGPVLSAKFRDEYIVSGSQDCTINLWKVPTSEDVNLGCVKTRAAVISVDWMEDNVISSTADSQLSLWDTSSGSKIRKYNNGSIINEVFWTGQLIASGDDDGNVKLWDSRNKSPVSTISTKYPILTVLALETQNCVYFSGIDPTIHAYDMRNFDKPLWETVNTIDSITSIALGPQQSTLVSRTTRGLVSIHNTKMVPSHVSRSSPYIYDGAPGKEGKLIRVCFSNDNAKILSGSDDNTTTMWELTSRRILNKFTGHEGAVLDVDYHEKDLVLSTSMDGTIIVRELS